MFVVVAVEIGVVAHSIGLAAYYCTHDSVCCTYCSDHNLCCGYSFCHDSGIAENFGPCFVPERIDSVSHIVAVAETVVV